LLDADDVTIVRRAVGDLAVEEQAGYFAALDPGISPELRLEGLARELISRVQRLRKETGFAVSDRIVLHVDGDEIVKTAVDAHRAWIAKEVLAVRIEWIGESASGHQAALALELDEVPARIAITKAE